MGIELFTIGSKIITLGDVLAGAGAVAALAGGAQQSAAYELEAEQQREEAENARVAAVQDEARRRRELARTLATQEAIRAGRGVDLYSGTGMAIRESTIEAAEADIKTARLNYLNKRRRFLLGAAQAEESATGGLLSGAAGAAGSLAKIKLKQD